MVAATPAMDTHHHHHHHRRKAGRIWAIWRARIVAVEVLKFYSAYFFEILERKRKTFRASGKGEGREEEGRKGGGREGGGRKGEG